MPPYPKKKYPKRKKTEPKFRAVERELLYDRCGGLCDWCGRPLLEQDMDAHHRQLRSAGGTWALSNLLAVHHDCHVNQPESIHMNPLDAMARNAIVSRYGDPAVMPYLRPGATVMWTLLDNGSIEVLDLPY